MTKEDANKILGFLEYVGKNMPVKDENFEYHTNTLFDCKCILADEVNDADTGHEPALNLAGVMPSFLTHPYAQVVCKNKGELNYVLEWAKQNGKEVSEHYYKVEKFPYHLFLAGDIVSWTDLTDRIGDKFSFREFVDGVNWA